MRPSIWLAIVGTILGAVAIVGWFWSEWVLPPAVFTGQAVACFVAAGILELRRERERPIVIPDLSYSTSTIAIGVATMLNGVAFGLWLVLIGAGLVALGLGGLAREHFAARRSAS
jgi:hypothetical protein